MKLFNTIYLLLFVLCGCNSNTNVNVKVIDMHMANTIKPVTELTFAKGKVQRGDIVAFRYFENLLDKEIDHVLRIVGIPGDELKIWQGDIFINQELYTMPGTALNSYYLKLKAGTNESVLAGYDFRQYEGLRYFLFIPATEAEKFAKQSFVDTFRSMTGDSLSVDSRLIAAKFGIGKSSYFINSFRLPRKGDTISDTVQALCHTFISVDQIGNKLEDDFYYLVGDNRFNSFDSRYIGLVPEKCILGILSDGSGRVLEVNELK